MIYDEYGMLSEGDYIMTMAGRDGRVGTGMS